MKKSIVLTLAVLSAAIFAPTGDAQAQGLTYPGYYSGISPYSHSYNALTNRNYGGSGYNNYNSYRNYGSSHNNNYGHNNNNYYGHNNYSRTPSHRSHNNHWDRNSSYYR